MYNLNVRNNKARTLNKVSFETLERAQMGMLCDMTHALLWNGEDLAQVGSILLDLLYRASRGELCCEVYAEEHELSACSRGGWVHGRGADMSYTIVEERG